MTRGKQQPLTFTGFCLANVPKYIEEKKAEFPEDPSRWHLNVIMYNANTGYIGGKKVSRPAEWRILTDRDPSTYKHNGNVRHISFEHAYVVVDFWNQSGRRNSFNVSRLDVALFNIQK